MILIVGVLMLILYTLRVQFKMIQMYMESVPHMVQRLMMMKIVLRVAQVMEVRLRMTIVLRNKISKTKNNKRLKNLTKIQAHLHLLVTHKKREKNYHKVLIKKKRMPFTMKRLIQNKKKESQNYQKQKILLKNQNPKRKQIYMVRVGLQDRS